MELRTDGLTLYAKDLTGFLACRHLTALERMAAHPRDAFESTKASLVRGALDLDPDEMRRYRDEVLPRWTKPEIKEKIRAVLGR